MATADSGKIEPDDRRYKADKWELRSQWVLELPLQWLAFAKFGLLVPVHAARGLIPSVRLLGAEMGSFSCILYHHRHFFRVMQFDEPFFALLE